MTAPLFVDTDLALGSPRGDVDDGFALAAVLLSGVPVAGLSSVHGNTSAERATENLRKMASRCGFAGPIHAGARAAGQASEASRALASSPQPVRFLGLGPATNLAAALRGRPAAAAKIEEACLVMTNRCRPLPAWRFFDFNQSLDRDGFRRVLESDIRITLLPCDVARRLRTGRRELESLPGELGRHLREESERWLRRGRLLKGVRTVPLWDLPLALYAVDSRGFEACETTLRLTRTGAAIFGRGGRPVRVLTGFDPSELWRRFVALLHRNGGR